VKRLNKAYSSRPREKEWEGEVATKGKKCDSKFAPDNGKNNRGGRSGKFGKETPAEEVGVEARRSTTRKAQKGHPTEVSQSNPLGSKRKHQKRRKVGEDPKQEI